MGTVGSNPVCGMPPPAVEITARPRNIAEEEVMVKTEVASGDSTVHADRLM